MLMESAPSSCSNESESSRKVGVGVMNEQDGDAALDQMWRIFAKKVEMRRCCFCPSFARDACKVLFSSAEQNVTYAKGTSDLLNAITSTT